jgi:hypothetical protein
MEFDEDPENQEYLVRQLVIKFAKINGYKLQPNVDVLQSQDPQIKLWIEMAEVAFEYLNENLY